MRNYSPALYVFGFGQITYSFLVSFFGCMCNETKFLLNLVPLLTGIFLIIHTYHYYKNCNIRKQKDVEENQN